MANKLLRKSHRYNQKAVKIKPAPFCREMLHPEYSSREILWALVHIRAKDADAAIEKASTLLKIEPERLMAVRI